MTKPVNVCWPRGRGFWDMGLLEDLFQHRWRPVGAHEFVHHVAPYRNPPYTVFDETLDPGDGVVAVLPARHCVAHYDNINEWLSRYAWVLLMVTGDEESNFDARRIQHPHIKRWQQLPKPGVHDFADRFLINGYPGPIHTFLPRYSREADVRPLNWYFSGQITHVRRQECAQVLRTVRTSSDGQMLYGVLQETEGFTQGVPHDEYYRLMASAKLIPCPSGAVMPDSFRLAEALEAGCIPIADGVSPRSDWPRGYWPYVFGEQPPFPVIEHWSEMRDLTIMWPEAQSTCFAWWQQYKRKLAYALRDDINSLRGEQTMDEKITVIIPTSPIPSHPETGIIDDVIASVRVQLPNAEIMLMFDGVRPAVEHRRAQYEEYKRRVLWKCNHEWKNVLPLVFNSPTQQAEMTRQTLPYVKTPYVLFMEHDGVLDAAPINWHAITGTLEAGEANMVRLYWREAIHPEHEYLMHGMYDSHGAQFIRTRQYSQWPNVASKSFYEKILTQHFAPGQRAMIETVMYGPVVNVPWENYKVVIYYPQPNAITWKHRNGRQGDPADW